MSIKFMLVIFTSMHKATRYTICESICDGFIVGVGALEDKRLSFIVSVSAGTP